MLASLVHASSSQLLWFSLCVCLLLSVFCVCWSGQSLKYLPLELQSRKTSFSMWALRAGQVRSGLCVLSSLPLPPVVSSHHMYLFLLLHDGEMTHTSSEAAISFLSPLFRDNCLLSPLVSRPFSTNRSSAFSPPPCISPSITYMMALLV